MLMLEILEQFPDEKTCKTHLRSLREDVGVCCKRCKSNEQNWLEKKEQWQCRKCGFRTTLKSGTLFQNTKMPLRIWFFTMSFMTLTKKGFSCKELQAQVEHKRYEPIWYMMHKIRYYMGKSNDNLSEMFTERGQVILNTILKKEPRKDNKQTAKFPKIKVYTAVEKVRRGEKIHSLRLQKSIGTSHFESLKSVTWPNHPLRNFIKIINGIHHRVETRYLQNYLNEFSYKFSMRQWKDQALDGLFLAAVFPYW